MKKSLFAHPGIRIPLSVLLIVIFAFFVPLTASAKKKTQVVVTPDAIIANSQLIYPARNALFRYNVYSGYVEITQYFGNTRSVTVPDTICGLPVYVIAQSAFANHSEIRTLSLGSEIYSIGASCFSGCSGMSSVTLPKSLSILGPSAFRNCSSLKSIVIPAAVQAISDHTFENCTSLRSFVVETSAMQTCEMDATAFGNCIALRVAWLPPGMAEIKDGTFKDANSAFSIYGVESSTAAAYCARNFIDFTKMPADDFVATLAANANILPQYPSKGETLSNNSIAITMDDYRILKRIGFTEAPSGCVFVAIDLTFAGTGMTSAYVNGLSAVASSDTQSVLPFYCSAESGGGYTPIGYVEPEKTTTGTLIFVAREDFHYVAIDFSAISNFANGSVMAVYG